MGDAWATIGREERAGSRGGGKDRGKQEEGSTRRSGRADAPRTATSISPSPPGVVVNDLVVYVNSDDDDEEGLYEIDDAALILPASPPPPPDVVDDDDVVYVHSEDDDGARRADNGRSLRQVPARCVFLPRR